MKKKILETLKNLKVVAVLRASSPENALEIATACFEGGVKAIELTYTTPQPEKALRLINEKLGDKILLGAGTILNVNQLKSALESGARFIVSPGFDLECGLYMQNNKEVPYIPGINSPSELMQVLKLDIKLVKLFPASQFSPKYIKALKGPFPNIEIMPTGGVSLDNINEWLKNGAVACGVGGNLTTGTYDNIVNVAKQYIEKISNN